MTLQKPLKCKNVYCGAMCSPIIASDYSDEPMKCPFYERRIDMYESDMIGKIRAEIQEEIEVYRMSDWETNNILADGLQMALNIIDRYGGDTE